MVQKIDPFIGSNYGWDNGEIGWGDGMNENLIQNAFFHNRRIDGVLTSAASLPSSPANGQAYFAVADASVYLRVDGVWYPFLVPLGMKFTLKTDESKLVFNGTTLVADTIPIAAVNGLQGVLNDKIDVSAFEDANNWTELNSFARVQVARTGALDLAYKFGVNGKSYLWDDAVFNGGSGVTNEGAKYKLYTAPEAVVIRSLDPAIAGSATLDFRTYAGTIAGRITGSTGSGGLYTFYNTDATTFAALIGKTQLTAFGSKLAINNTNDTGSTPALTVSQNSVQRGQIVWPSTTQGQILDGSNTVKISYDSAAIVLHSSAQTLGTHTATAGFSGGAGAGLTNTGAIAKLLTNANGGVVQSTGVGETGAQLSFINTAGDVTGAIQSLPSGGGLMLFKTPAYAGFLAIMGVNSFATNGNALTINNVNNTGFAPEIDVLHSGVRRGKIVWSDATTGAILDGSLNPKFSYTSSAVTLHNNTTVLGNVTATGQFNGSGAGLTNVPSANLSGTVSDANLPATQAGKLFTSGVEIDSNQGPSPSFAESQLIVGNAASGNPAAITFWRKGVTAVQLFHASDGLLELRNFTGLGADFSARDITATGGILGASIGLGTSSMGSDLFRVNGTSQLFGALTVNAAISATGLIESTGNLRGNAVQSRNGFAGLSGANADWGNLIWTAASTWEFRAVGGSRQFGFDGTNITTGIPILSTAPITTSAPITSSAPIAATGAGFYYGANRVLGARSTGWGAPTGTASRSSFDTATVTTAQLAERLKALIDDLAMHGLIGA